MWAAPDTEGVRHVHDLLALGEAARGADVRLNDVHRAPREDVAKAEARTLGLTARHRDRLPCLDLEITIDVFRWNRFFEPGDVTIFDAAREADGVDGIVGAIRIDHQ